MHDIPKKELITPEKAEVWLMHNDNNRKLNKSLVKRYAEAIKRGEWKLNGDTIRFSESGKLLDGQHRLNAIIIAQTPVESYVIYNLPEETFDTIDLGRKRTNTDVLFIRGYKNPGSLSSFLTLVYFHNLGGVDKIKKFPFPTPAEIEQLLESDRNAFEHSKEAIIDIQNGNNIVSAPISMYVHYLLCKSSCEKQANVFFASLYNGFNLSAGSPILWLRNHLIRIKTDGLKINQVHAVALVIKAWNAYVQKREVDHIKYSSKEEYPQIFIPQRDLLDNAL